MFSEQKMTRRKFRKYSSNTTLATIALQDGWTERETMGFVYISKNPDDELIIMSPVCTHLGCTVPFADEAQKMNNIEFFCPCHGGQYNEEVLMKVVHLLDHSIF